MTVIHRIFVTLLVGMSAAVASGQTSDSKPAPTPASQTSLFGQSDLQAELRFATRRAELIRQEYEKAYMQTLDLRQAIRAKTGRMDVERGSLDSLANKLDQDLQTLALEQAGSHARIEAIEEAIAEQSKRVEKASASDQVIAELEKVADARERQLKIVENERKTGVGTDAALQEAIAALAEARAKVAERRQAVFTGNGGDALTSLNRELLSLSIADRERRAKIQFLDAQLAKITPELGRTLELELQERNMAIAMSDLRLAEANLRELRLSASEAAEKPAAPQTKPAKSSN
jgi:hypothetical protein